jgi:hypothetical protein
MQPSWRERGSDANVLRTGPDTEENSVPDGRSGWGEGITRKACEVEECALTPSRSM